METNGYLPSNSPVFFIEESDDENNDMLKQAENNFSLFDNDNSIDIANFCEAYCTDPRYQLGLLDETQDSVVAESPNESFTNDTNTVINFPGLLPTSNNNSPATLSSESSNSSPILSASQSSSVKRIRKKMSRGRTNPFKLVKLEGVTCKLNGKRFQLYCRGLDVIEALEDAITSVEKKIHNCTRSSPNFRLLNLDLSQIETVINILSDSEQLELEMSLEAWNDMFLVTKTAFQKVQKDLQLCQTKSFELDSTAETLSKVFSENLNISSQSKKIPEAVKVAGRITKTATRRQSQPNTFSASIPKPLVTQEEETLHQNLEEEEVDFIESSQKPITSRRGRPPKPPAPSSVKARMETPFQSKEKPSNVFKSTEPAQSEEFVLLRGRQSFTAPKSSPLWENVPFVNKEIHILPESPSASLSITAISTEEVLIEQYKSSQSTNSDDLDQSQRSQMAKAATRDEKLKRISQIVRMNFSLRSFVVSNVLSPGADNIKMNFDSKVYVGSLKIDGSIEMKSFIFPNIGSWFKNVIGKRFTMHQAKEKQKLELLYNEEPGSDKWRPLDEIINLDTISKSNTMPKRRYTEIPFTTPPSLSKPPVAANAAKERLPEIPSQDCVGLKLQLVPDELIHHVNTILVHSPAEFFRTHHEEEFWKGNKPFPKHLLDELDQW